MVTKMKSKNKSKSSAETSDIPLSDSVKDSAQLIWQAGLGAFNKAQAEGTKAFEALVKEGVDFQRKTHLAAEEKMNEASNKLAEVANGFSAKASGQWDKLETIFEDRVTKALNKLGVPSRKDIDILIQRVDALNMSVQKLSAQATPAAVVTQKSAKPVPQASVKTAAKPSPKTTVKVTKVVAKTAAPRRRAKSSSVTKPT